MQMNRRRFLSALAAGGIITAEGLWVPGAKLISIPKPRLDPLYERSVVTWRSYGDPIRNTAWIRRVWFDGQKINAELVSLSRVYGGAIQA